MKEYKTIFVEAREVVGKGMFKKTTMMVNGDDLSRDIQATLTEMVLQGFQLEQSIPIASSKVYMSSYPYTYTNGVLLIFGKENDQL